MLKHPGSQYTGKRSDFMLKYKPCFDSEAIIVNYTEGSGKYKNMLGAFVCKPLINKGNESIIDEDENEYEGPQFVAIDRKKTYKA